VNPAVTQRGKEPTDTSDVERHVDTVRTCGFAVRPGLGGEPPRTPIAATLGDEHPAGVAERVEREPGWST
jgi:hypothetical protein